MPRPPDPDRPQEDRPCAACNAVTVHRLRSAGPGRRLRWQCVPCSRLASLRSYRNRGRR